MMFHFFFYYVSHNKKYILLLLHKENLFIAKNQKKTVKLHIANEIIFERFNQSSLYCDISVFLNHLLITQNYIILILPYDEQLCLYQREIFYVLWNVL